MLRASFPSVSPYVVDVSALSICIVLRAFVVVISMCLLYMSLGSGVSPSIFGLMIMVSVMLSICSSSCVLYSTGSGAILKMGKTQAIPKSYIPISLLCHMYKLYERLILNRIAPSVDRHLIKEEAGFRTRKSCYSQLLNLTQHIEDGYQRGMITSAALVDLSAAYDTVNIDFLSGNYMTLQRTAHYVELFKICW